MSERGGGWGEGRRGASERARSSAADRHSVATLSHRLAGPPIERRRKEKKSRDENRWRSSLLDPVEHQHVECFQTPRLKNSKYAM